MIKANKFRKRRIADRSKVNRPIQDIPDYKLERCIALLKEYSQGSTLHGVQHIFRDSETTLHRVIWSSLFLLCFSGATYMTFNCWENYVNYPIAISVEDTHYPLADVLFPAVSICPTNKILISQAISYLSSRIQPEILNDTQIFDFLTSLILLQHPVYSQMAHYLQNSQALLPLLSNINISELMYKSMPSCEEIFITCYWQGIRKNCCKDLFFFQKSEEGFCYSFNSLTSQKFGDCSYLDLKKPGCKIRSSSSVGPTTGLEIFFKVLDPNKYKSIELSGGPKLKVEIHNPIEYPEAGIGSMMPIGKLNKMSVAVKPTIIMSTDGIRSLKQEDRGCIFKDEKTPLMALTYSQKSCLIECRVNFMIKMCQCVPYYFYRDETYPVCNSVQLYCILNISGKYIAVNFFFSFKESLRFYKPPNSVVEDFHPAESKNTLDCHHCLPTCNEVNYDAITELSKDQFAKRVQQGYIDVFYKSSGAVKYKRDITYDLIKLIVDMGAIGGLFLGGSLLSILEIIYWLSKSLISIRWSLKHDNIRQQDPKKIFNPALLLIDNQTFFNKKIIVTKLNTRRF
ncbi:sodium channel protein Nach-like [Cimex lectularius]|uniref:Pickpocket n=1 Tax=Cimex lectularius TaxID=79782 RepID=A0A8I6SEM9_CIMLE|nr:sodium channel protein Nach-like [Cimex lectularius]